MGCTTLALDKLCLSSDQVEVVKLLKKKTIPVHVSYFLFEKIYKFHLLSISAAFGLFGTYFLGFSDVLVPVNFCF
jgi:hypothetical protein